MKILISLLITFVLSGCFSAKEKAIKEDVQRVLKEKYGLYEDDYKIKFHEFNRGYVAVANFNTLADSVWFLYGVRTDDIYCPMNFIPWNCVVTGSPMGQRRWNSPKTNDIENFAKSINLIKSND